MPTKVHLVKSYGFSSSHVWMWEVDYKESWAPKNDAFELWCWRRLLRVPWTARSNQSILKDISPEYSLEGLMLKLMHSVLWPPDAKNWITGKDPDAGKDWRWEEKGTTEDGVVGWHHQLDALWVWASSGNGDGQGSLACCSPCSCKESDMTEWLNWAMHSKGSTVGQKVSGLEANPELGAHLDQPLHAVSSFRRLQECWHHESWG